jgi:N-acyl-D-aspartate/D-glutamate deacylase
MRRDIEAKASRVIEGATIIDGTGSPPSKADLLIEHGMITAIEKPGILGSARSIPNLDVKGLVVCPGFIDVHSHADNAPFLAQDDLTKIGQGITTEVIGNCGLSLAPIENGNEAEFLLKYQRHFAFEYVGWHTVADLLTAVDLQGTVTNICPLVGHGSLRLAAMGSSSRVATMDDVRLMGALLTEALEAGAFGMSSGLIYPPGVYSDTAELVGLALYLPAERVYATHMRNEGPGLLRSIKEALTIGREAGCRVEISHLKSCGKQNWGGVVRALELLDDARRDDLRVTQDVYPYAAASTTLGVCLPPWVHAGGDEATLARLRDPSQLLAIQTEIEESSDDTWENTILGAGYDGVMLSRTRSHRYEGMTLAEVAAARGLEPFDALITVLAEEELDARIIEFSMSESDVETVLSSPFTMIGSDGTAPGFSGGRAHPRLYGTFPRVLGRYVRELGVLNLTEAIRKMTSLPAEVFGVPQRGKVAVGMMADLVCFDPITVGHPGDYLNPSTPPVGIAWVMQEGHVVMQEGRWAETRRGKRLIPS